MTDSGGLIVVTGATGNVGSDVTRGLLAAGAGVRVAARDPDAARATFPSAEVVRFEFGEEHTYPAAFEGARTLFLVRPPQIADVKDEILPALDAARAAGVQRVVFLSLQGAERNPVVPHRHIEEHLKAHGSAWTFLRPGFFMQNLSSTHRRDVAERDEVFVPAGRGRTSFIDTRDIADIAVKVLTESGHERRAYELTGSEALTYAEVARVLTAELGREIRYPNPAPWRFWRRLRARGEPPGYVLVMIVLYTACRLGLAARVTSETERLLGRAPRTFRAFAREHAAAWDPVPARASVAEPLTAEARTSGGAG